ncbi:MAG: anti-sigma factor [Cyanobacteriota bacterium]|nr:anti-sigma factor [Cyanobacteriota bacterium]
MTDFPSPETTDSLLAGYVLGDLSPEEAQAVEALLAAHPDLTREMAILQEALALLPYGLPPSPPPQHLRQQVLRQVFPQAVAEPQRLSQASLAKRPSWIPWLVAASALLAALLGLDNWRLRQSLQLAQESSSSSPAPQDLSAFWQRSDLKVVALTTPATSSPSQGSVFFTPQWREMVVALTDLPPLTEQQVYRLWVTLDNGNTVYCGEFRVDEGGQVLTLLRPESPFPAGAKGERVWITANATTDSLDQKGSPILSGTL